MGRAFVDAALPLYDVVLQMGRYFNVGFTCKIQRGHSPALASSSIRSMSRPLNQRGHFRWRDLPPQRILRNADAYR